MAMRRFRLAGLEFGLTDIVTLGGFLALILLAGSTVGAQFGAVAGRRLKGEQIRILLAIIVLVLTVKMFLDLVLTPSDLVSLATSGGGH